MKQVANAVLLLLLASLLALACVGCDDTAVTTTQRLMAFTSKTCPPCQRDKPTLNQLKSSFDVVEVDVDANPELARQYKVQFVPTYIVFDVEGQQIERTNDIRTILKLVRWLQKIR